MKVRCKGIWAGSEWTVIEESPNFYIAKCNTAAGTASLPKADYEPVQEWKDVTTNCFLQEDGAGRYSLFHFMYAIHADDPKYRVTTQRNSFKVECKS